MKNHPVLWFYVLAFAVAWLGWLPMVAGSRGIAPFNHPIIPMLLLLPAVGPGLAAIIVMAATEGKASVNRLLKPLVQWRVGARLLVIAVIAPALLLLAAQIVTQVLGLTATPGLPTDNLIGMVIAVFVMAVFSNTWEEIGWRGFALPRLQQQHTAFVATLIVGVLWGLWHLPLFFWLDNPMSNYPFLPWFIGTIALSFIYTWLYNTAAGSLLVVTLFHVFSNTFGVVISGVSVTALAIVYIAVALVLVAVFGKDHLARRERVRAS